MRCWSGLRLGMRFRNSKVRYRLVPSKGKHPQSTRSTPIKQNSNKIPPSMPNANRLILVDTNCLVRIFFSPLRPLMRNPVCGYELRTLYALAEELKSLTLRGEFAWLADGVILTEVDAAVVALTRAQSLAVRQDYPGIRSYGNAELKKYCESKNLTQIRSLSSADAKALATALELNAGLATDEWPLRYVASYYDYDDGNPLELHSSVELIALFEKAGLLSKDDRKKTYADWLKTGARLLRESDEMYKKLFNEPPPTAQH